MIPYNPITSLINFFKTAFLFVTAASFSGLAIGGIVLVAGLLIIALFDIAELKEENIRLKRENSELMQERNALQHEKNSTKEL